jgi:hypothetical protein
MDERHTDCSVSPFLLLITKLPDPSLRGIDLAFSQLSSSAVAFVLQLAGSSLLLVTNPRSTDYIGLRTVKDGLIVQMIGLGICLSSGVKRVRSHHTLSLGSGKDVGGIMIAKLGMNFLSQSDIPQAGRIGILTADKHACNSHARFMRLFASALCPSLSRASYFCTKASSWLTTTT